jgi:beta-glucosidase
LADVAALLSALTLEEKAALTAGEDFFSTPAIDRLGIPKVRLTDGPNGARGSDALPGTGGAPSTCVPCGSAIGATWDPELAQQIGALLGRETLDRGCRFLLAPTVNLHRSPRAGRNFECYSEDPLLSGRLAAGMVRGIQAQQVVATIKHFVGNEAEFERSTISSVIDERALRELYLLPFEIAVREAGVLGLMTAYNRLNRRWLTEQGAYLTDLLRGEWGFEGLVMTDWFGAADTDASVAAGLDLEMPGPGRAFGPALVAAIEQGRVETSALDAPVRRILTVLDRIGALDEPCPPIAPVPPTADDVAMLRRAAADACVLLTNDGTLPLPAPSTGRVALIGPHVDRPQIMGGGSAAVVPHHLETFAAAVSTALGGEAQVRCARGCEIDVAGTVLGTTVFRAPDGFDVEVYDGLELAGPVVLRQHLDELRLFLFAGLNPEWPEGECSMRVRGTVVPEETGDFELALAQLGRTRVFVDGELVLDGVADPPPPGGTDFFGMGSQELLRPVSVVAGTPVELLVDFVRDSALGGFRVGFHTVATDDLFIRAVDVARDADVAVMFVGTSPEWESEGHDRTTLALPGRQDELVRAVAAVNERTVVVVNAGAPIEMDWADDVAAVLQCWFGGQEMAGAVADVLVGRAEPGGRLPVTLPIRLAHNPAHDNFPGEYGEVRYGEGLFMGYRGYEHRGIEPRFPFGHGLSFTSFEIGDPELSASTFRRGDALTVTVPVRNSGARPGSHVVQLYVAPEAPRVARPVKELKGFAKVRLDPGESTTMRFDLDVRAFAYWRPAQDRAAVDGRVPDFIPMVDRTMDDDASGWQVDPGWYRILIASSAADIAAERVVEISAEADPAVEPSG